MIRVLDERDKIELAKQIGLVAEASGKTVCLKDSSDMQFGNIILHGKSVQEGTPTPDAPIEIKSVENPEVKIYGGNLIPYPYNGLINQNEEVKWTVNNDRSISVSGTPTAQRYFALVLQYKLAKGVYTLSGCPSGGQYQKYWMYVERKSDGYVWYEVGNGVTFEVESEGVYDVAINVGSLAGTITNLTFVPMLNAGEKAIPYELYKEEQKLMTPYTLHGIPVASGGNYTDADGQQWVCDEVDFERGVLVQRIKKVIVDGSSDILKNDDSASTWLYFYRTENKDMDENVHAVCDKLQYTKTSATYGNLGFNNSSGSYRVIYINISSYMSGNTLDALKETLNQNPLTFMYALADPIETPLAKEELEVFKALYSHKPTTSILIDNIGDLTVEYIADAKTYIDNKIAELTS